MYISKGTMLSEGSRGWGEKRGWKKIRKRKEMVSSWGASKKIKG
jgi:hypothetical protein